MLEVVQLSRNFGPRVAVQSASLSVKPGEVVGLVGPNGAGKTALLQMIAGFLAPTAGTALVCGHDIRKRPLAAKRRLGYLPQTAPAYPEMTAAGFLGFIARLRGLRRAAARTRIGELADRLSLADVLDRRIATLPEDRRRLLGIAQALLHDPPVLLLDAPSDGLDPARQHAIRALLGTLAADKATLVATHRLDEVERLCSRVIIMAKGRILADAAPGDLARRSRYYNAVRLALPGGADGAAIPAELALLPFVRAVEPAYDAEGAGCWVFPWHGRPIIAEIAEFARARDWPLAALRPERGRLDDVFQALTMPDADQPL
jgi:ABC-2 type transport system ATP-binding protein